MIDAADGLPSNGAFSVEPSLEWLFSQQVNEWMRGDRPPIKTFLERHPELVDHPTAAIELINQEIVLRQIRGETPRPEDYLIDFPDLAEPLSRLFEVHGGLSIPPGLRASHALTSERGVTKGERSAIASAPWIPGYEIEGILGRGGMGVVYLARHRALDRQVALKLPHEGREADPAQRARFKREAAAVAKCQHPNLVQIHEIGDHNGQSYLALEYVEGETLARSLAGKPQPPMAAAALVETLARAINHAHCRGVVHRDLKPANVLLTADGQPKITDFGLAKIDRSTTQTDVGTIMGTLAYMAPEQAIGGTAEIGPRADIYALGAILYEALTGRPPYRAETPEQLYHELVHSDVVPPSRSQTATPRDLEAICLKCLEKSPLERYATALELADDLRRFQRGDPIQARRIGTLRRFLKWARRHPWQTTEAATAIVAGLAFMAMTHGHNIELKAEVRRTQAQAALARLNYQEARSTIQAMLGQFKERHAAGLPQLLDLHRDQHEAALAFYDRVLGQADSTDPGVQSDTARALLEESVLQAALGQREQAEASARRAQRLIDGLRRQWPADLAYLKLDVECLMKRCVYLHQFRGRDEAVSLGRQAVELAQQLAALLPDDLAVQDLLAACHNNYGDVLSQRQPHEAQVHFQRAIEIRERIDSAGLPGVNFPLAESLINKGVVLWSVREFARAEETFRRAEKLLIPLARGPEGPKAKAVIGAAQLYLNWSGMLPVTGHADEAIARCELGLELLEPYIRLEPHDAGAREIRLKLHGNRGYALAVLGRHREAATEWMKVIELSPQPVPAVYRVHVAVDLLRAGEVDRAVTQAGMVKPAPDVSPDDRYNLGCLYSLFASAAHGNKRASVDERERLAESRITKALGWLKSAARSGYFHDPANREYARHDPDLTILAKHDEFRRLFDQPALKP